MQLGTSEDEEAGQSNDQQDVSSASERAESEVLQDLQEELDSFYLDYIGMESLYEDKCADYKKLQRMYRKVKKESRALREVSIV